ncbi:nitroreductase family protein [Jiangella asiatica]|uniref:Nitroreductase family protein n=1 Tax=Jiangella asiatica TaxID=2530372 RepID=A0A4R5DDR3_9ACTN|nr:nitroreductase family protein [Jiangella asiatica]TDE10100.1 nitroreductase family protein [Jiangella asiatica]
MDTRVTDHLLSTTRAVRRKLDLDREVEPEVIAQCLRLAVQAPTPGPSQSWRWLVVRDQETRGRIAELFREVGAQYMRDRIAVAGAAANEAPMKRILESGQHLVDIIDRVPVLVIPCVVGRPTGRNAADSVFYGGIFPAVWSFQLALRSRGLGSTLTSYHLEREEQAARILGIPDGVTQVGLLPVAYTTSQDFKPGTRQPVEELSYLDRWGSPLF